MADTLNVPDTCPQCGQKLRLLDPAADTPEAEAERIDAWLREGAAAYRKTARRLGAAEATGYAWEVSGGFEVTYDPSRPGLAVVTLAYDGGPHLHGHLGAALALVFCCHALRPVYEPLADGGVRWGGSFLVDLKQQLTPYLLGSIVRCLFVAMQDARTYLRRNEGGRGHE
jgi:hypothetical protein